MYRIENVTDYKGNIKPYRIGRIVDDIEELQGSAFCVYTNCPQNKDVAGKALWTSRIVSREENDNEVIIKTDNSIYHFRRIYDY